jgi:hypothetical protein
VSNYTEPTDDEREALARVIEEGWGNPTWDGVTLRPIDRQIADAVLAAGFRRQGPITDAQITAALVGWEGQPTRVDAMRAALEAARDAS